MKMFIMGNLDLLSYISLFLSNFTSALIIKMYMTEGKFGYYGFKLSKFIDNLTFLQLFIILFTFYHIVYILFYFGLYLLDMADLNISITNTKYLNMAADTPREGVTNNSGTGPTIVNTINNNNGTQSLAVAKTAANASIVVAGITAGAKMATSYTFVLGGTPMHKAVVYAGAIVSTGVAIVAKDAAEEISSKIFTKSNSLISPLKDIIKSSLNLTGEATLDLLKLIDFINQMQSLYLLLLIFNFIIYLINLNKLEVYLSLFKINTTLIHYIIKYLKYLQKSSFVMIICLLLLLVISTYLSTYYFHFFYINFDKICKVIIK